MEEHKSTVARLAAEVARFSATKTPFRIYHGSTLSTRQSSRQRSQIIDVSSLNHVLQFDKAKKTVLVEPNVSMDRLVEATLAQGLLPKVVMELPNITVGGGFAGTSGESSSYKYGLFDRTISGIEIILGNGDVVWATAEEHRDLFFTAAGSCGSLGVITLVEMELIDARDYVELHYIPVTSTQEAVQVLRKYQNEPDVDYMDGIMYSMTRGVVMIGRLTNSTGRGKIQRFDRAQDPWFYMHAEDVLMMLEGETTEFKETIPVQTYLFRYDRGVFWSGLRAFKYFVTPFNRITRYLLDPFMYSRTMVHALHRSGIASRTIIQDYGVPYDAAEEFVQWTDERTGIWPLWLCPVKSAPRDERSFSQGNNIKDDILLDVGIWDMGPADSHAFIKLNRDFEAKVTELGGMKCLYAHAYYTEQEFWDIYDEKKYKELRRKYHAESLPSVYDKVKVDLQGVVGEKRAKRVEGWSEWAYRRFWDTWPLGGLYGVASATKGLLVQSDFLLKK
ncbi:delta-sterol reductase [Parastagonospora nodorum]|uniref:Delta(24)-sterol reductase n=1 Tax=Phaeosphaeria nodorum (strain SN15 / ATCC MYA-4574 / FGSC 10173) TaxID=321614 RepID=A0A7U2ERA3_PHANO|nr:delta-sterol reductase [Parastagonospora nodorum]QRC91569.1 delta-sterol reductase [Parastagonospora nodorum SN15]KAH3928164.1 delta-sterol reductase [Parastagonospora nodorum]KAH3948890.1 delta-sterol reductase [Parastagonospora nodorum]KAH4061324.1 delta-sterol reductase [Parastagonospora nodorum]